MAAILDHLKKKKKIIILVSSESLTVEFKVTTSPNNTKTHLRKHKKDTKKRWFLFIFLVYNKHILSLCFVEIQKHGFVSPHNLDKCIILLWSCKCIICHGCVNIQTDAISYTVTNPCSQSAFCRLFKIYYQSRRQFILCSSTTGFIKTWNIKEKQRNKTEATEI